ncbi:MAG: hypothetical protein NT062_02810 [Proteobacteria bacterium]|nr:hypothetical protein [Pseudomonadota bacterium]
MAPLAAVILALAVVACADEAPVGQLTDATCPPTAAPTYANFGAAFFDSHCLACHSETKVGVDRAGAPPTIDFDTLALVRENTSRIDQQAAFGPTIHNRLMPPANAMVAVPSDDERRQLGQFLACLVGR